MNEYCFQGFKGSIETIDETRCVVNGEIATISDTKVS